MIHIPRVPNDVVRMKFIPFALKNDAQRWMCGLKVGSIKSWDTFVDIFPERYSRTRKTIGVRNEILCFVQLEHEPFWKNMNMFKELLTQCPHHGLEKCNLRQIAYKSLDVRTRTIVESGWGRISL